MAGKSAPPEEPISVRSAPQKSIPREVTRRAVVDEWQRWCTRHPVPVTLAAGIAFHGWLQETQPRLLKAGDFGGRNRFSAIWDWVQEWERDHTRGPRRN